MTHGTVNLPSNADLPLFLRHPILRFHWFFMFRFCSYGYLFLSYQNITYFKQLSFCESQCGTTYHNINNEIPCFSPPVSQYILSWMVNYMANQKLNLILRTSHLLFLHRNADIKALWCQKQVFDVVS